jgi:hypothetical protein
MLPGLTSVSGFIHPVTMAGHHAAGRVFSHPDVNHVHVAGGNGDGTDGSRFEVAVGYVEPSLASVDRFPQTASGGAHVSRQRIIG